MKRSYRRAILPGIVALGLGLALTACGGDSEGTEGGGASGSVSVDGSSTVFPMSDAAYELLAEENPDIKVTVGESGTGGGFEKFCADQTDISDASRPIDEEDEVPVCKEAGVEYTELQVATDALTVVVHPDLDVDCLTVEQLVELWAPGSKITNWNQLDPSFPDEEITLFGPGTDSGTYDYMASEIVDPDAEEPATRDDYESSEDDNVLVQGVAGTEGGTGYFGYTYYEENADTLKAAGDRQRQRLCRAVGRDRPGRGVHAAGPPAVHLREERGVQRQRGRQGVRRLLHREPGRDRRGGEVHPAERRALQRDPGQPRRHLGLKGALSTS